MLYQLEIACSAVMEDSRSWLCFRGSTVSTCSNSSQNNGDIGSLPALAKKFCLRHQFRTKAWSSGTFQVVIAWVGVIRRGSSSKISWPCTSNKRITTQAGAGRLLGSDCSAKLRQPGTCAHTSKRTRPKPRGSNTNSCKRRINKFYERA